MDPARQKLRVKFVPAKMQGGGANGESLDTVGDVERIDFAALRQKILHPSQSEDAKVSRPTGRKQKYVDPNDEEDEELTLVRYDPVKSRGKTQSRKKPSKIVVPKVFDEETEFDEEPVAAKQKDTPTRVEHTYNPLVLEEKTTEEPSEARLTSSKVVNSSGKHSKVSDTNGEETTTRAPQFEAFYPREAYGIPNSAVRAPHGHGSFYKYRNPALVDTKNAAAYGFRFDGKRRFNFDAEGPIESDFDSEARVDSAGESGSSYQ